jgi:hypothetical protein
MKHNQIISSLAGAKTVDAYSMECTVRFQTVIKARNEADAQRKFKDALLDCHLIAKPRADWGLTFFYDLPSAAKVTGKTATKDIHCTQINRGSRKYASEKSSK